MFQKLRAPSYFSGCNICFTIDRRKWPHALLNSFSESFATSPQTVALHTFRNTTCTHGGSATIHKNTGRALQKQARMMKSARKDQSFYIISAINTLVHLPTTCFFFLLAGAHFPLFCVQAVPHAAPGLAR